MDLCTLDPLPVVLYTHHYLCQKGESLNFEPSKWPPALSLRPCHVFSPYATTIQTFSKNGTPSPSCPPFALYYPDTLFLRSRFLSTLPTDHLCVDTLCPISLTVPRSDSVACLPITVSTFV